MSIKFNDEQQTCIARINEFITNQTAFSKLIINGSAGTGKTTILISSIIDYITLQILNNYTDDQYTKFIIAAPTNKAKDVLISKYNTSLNSIKDDILVDRYKLNNIVNKKINFLTVSQILSINCIINEMGDDEFTKGNITKITEKYKKPNFDNTIIIIDECSMIDTNTINLLNIIRCPIIYIGDYCQLPPIQDIISPIFNYNTDGLNIECIQLVKVERCKNDITNIANKLRDKIYNIIPDFNILTNKIDNIIHYQKKVNDWLDKYVIDITNKITELNDNTTTHNNEYDTIALAWTNKCCAELNKMIRIKLYKDINYLDNFINKGDKLLVKVPYYKYNTPLYSSSIAYVSELQQVQYKPLSFNEWCNLSNETLEQTDERLIFLKCHSYKVITAIGIYEFNDIVSRKYSIINGIDLMTIKYENNPDKRIELYKQWHVAVSILLFGIPIDNVICKKCQFFIKKFKPIMENSCYVEELHNATSNLILDMYLTNLLVFTTSSKIKYNNIPILDNNTQENLTYINNIKNIIKSSYEVKLVLTKQDEHELKAINKTLNEDTNTTSQKYITMSQMFGHYLNHVITSSYLDVDYGYALTVHKSQGSTYNDIYIEYKNILANKKDTEKYKLLYTAITRCKNNIHIYY